MEYNTLFTPMKIGNCIIKNRVVLPPMHISLGNFDGTLSEKLINYYEERAIGGAGLIILEATRVNDQHGVTSFLQPSISKDYHIVRMNQLVNKVHKQGGKLFVQLQHPGMKTSGLMVNTIPIGLGLSELYDGSVEKILKHLPSIRETVQEMELTFSTVAPSKCENVPIVGGKARALKNSEIKGLVDDFVKGAARCKLAGADGVELQAAQGYLIQQFLSPYTNQRSDEYGGSFENRLRFLKEIILGIKRDCGENFPIIVRLSADELYKSTDNEEQKGYTLETGVEIAKVLETLGVDAIDVTCGTYENINNWIEPTSYDFGWSSYMAKAVKEAVRIPIISASKIRNASQAETLLADGIQDFVALGRSQLADPYWVSKVQSGKEDTIKNCLSCLNCVELIIKGTLSGKAGTCAVNPAVGRERELKELNKNGNNRVVVVVGAGVAGLTAAEVLSERGFKVIILEKSEKAGGQLNFASVPPKKQEIYYAISNLLVSVESLGCEIHYNTKATLEHILALNPYAVVIATGAKAEKPSTVKGASLENVFTVEDVLSKEFNEVGKNFAVVGSGLTGLETASYLIELGNKITVIEAEDEIARTAWFQLKDVLIPKMKEAKTTFLLNTKLCSIEEDGVIVEISENEPTKLFFDGIVLSLGSKSVNSLYEELKNNMNNVYAIGDSEKIGNIARATTSAFDVASKL